MKLLKAEHNFYEDLKSNPQDNLMIEVNVIVNDIINSFKIIVGDEKESSIRNLNMKPELHKEKIQIDFEEALIKTELIQDLLKQGVFPTNEKFNTIYNHSVNTIKRIDSNSKTVKNIGYILCSNGNWDEESLKFRNDKIDLKFLINKYKKQAADKDIDFSKYSEKQRKELQQCCLNVFKLLNHNWKL